MRDIQAAAKRLADADDDFLQSVVANDPDMIRAVAAAFTLSPPDAAVSAGTEWRDIASAPRDTSKGDFLIMRINSRGDFCWVQIVRNPRNHHGMTIATHWRTLDGDKIEGFPISEGEAT